MGNKIVQNLISSNYHLKKKATLKKAKGFY